MRFMSRTFHLACALLLATVATPLHAAKADRILIVVSGEGRDQGKTRPGYEFDELSQAWLIFQANGFAIDVASPQGGAVEADKYNPQEPFNAALLADADAMRVLADTRKTGDVKATDYTAVYVVGGKGAMFDLPRDTALTTLLGDAYERGVVIGAVCHGPAALLEVMRDDGTPLNYTLVNIKDWCKNTFEVVNQLRINTDYSHHRYDVLILINGVPCVQVELKTLGISPRRAMEQIVDYKNDPGNGYSKTLLCFLQLFIVSNRTDTWYFANNNARHFAFNQDERFLPIYQFADEANQKISHLDHFAETFLPKCTLGEAISRRFAAEGAHVVVVGRRPLCRAHTLDCRSAMVPLLHQILVGCQPLRWGWPQQSWLSRVNNAS